MTTLYRTLMRNSFELSEWAFSPEEKNMSQKHFVKLLLGSKTYKDQVSTSECSNVADFKKAAQNAKIVPFLEGAQQSSFG